MPFQSRITSKGQVTVPIQIRRKLGLRRGDKVEFRERGAEPVIRRAPDPKNPFDKCIGILKGKLKMSSRNGRRNCAMKMRRSANAENCNRYQRPLCPALRRVGCREVQAQLGGRAPGRYAHNLCSGVC